MHSLLSTLSIPLLVLFVSAHPAFSDGIIYDSGFQIYWMQDGNKAGNPMNWTAANTWAENLVYDGYDDWHLPTTPDGTWGYNSFQNSTKYNVTVSDLGHLFYTLLGNQVTLDSSATFNSISYGPGYPGLFTNLQAGYYWFGTLSNTTDSSSNKMGWIFDFQHGCQFLASTNQNAYAIAVRKAEPVPEPTSAVLFLSGLAGFCCYRSKQNY